jgi:hypothetical protein
VREGEGQHVEVAEGEGEAALRARGAQELRDLPGLRGAVAEVGVVWLAFVGGVELRLLVFLDLDDLGIWDLTCVQNTSSSSPPSMRTVAHATPLPTYQSPLKKAVGRPLSAYRTMALSTIGQRERMTSPPPKTPLW